MCILQYFSTVVLMLNIIKAYDIIMSSTRDEFDAHSLDGCLSQTCTLHYCGCVCVCVLGGVVMNDWSHSHTHTHRESAQSAVL